MLIRPATTTDAAAIARLYNYYVRHTVISFETDEVSELEMCRRMEGVWDLGLPWLVLETDEPSALVGFAYANQFRNRVAYQYTVESTIYLEANQQHRGLGKQLYSELLAQLKARGVHVVLGCIAVPNQASVGLHESVGFEQRGMFPKIGYKFDQWIDVGYWQLTFSVPPVSSVGKPGHHLGS